MLFAAGVSVFADMICPVNRYDLGTPSKPVHPLAMEMRRIELLSEELELHIL